MMNAELPDDLCLEFEEKAHGVNLNNFHYHNAYEIYFLKTGKRNLVINDTLYDTQTNDAAMILPNQFHRSYGNTPYSGFCISFTEKYLDKYFTQAAKAILLDCFRKPIITLDRQSASAVENLVQLASANHEKQFICLARLLSLFHDVSKKDTPGNGLISGPELSPIMVYIKKNFVQIKTLDDVAKALYLSKNYLCGLFKKQTGMTITYYINSLRTQFACDYLIATTHSVKKISSLCGFESPSYFNKVFKKFMGCSPSEFREKFQNETVL